MKTRRGEPSLDVEEIVLLAKISRPLPDTFHGLKDPELRYRQLRRPPDERGDAGRVRHEGSCD